MAQASAGSYDSTRPPCISRALRSAGSVGGARQTIPERTWATMPATPDFRAGVV